MKRYTTILLSVPVLLLLLVGCAPEVGSKEWCKVMEEKPKGDWSVNEAGDYAKHCIIK